MEIIKLGKDRMLTLPEELCERLGIQEGDPFIVFLKDGTIAVEALYEIHTPERIAEFLLNNSCSKEEFDLAVENIKALGLDPAKIPFTDLNDRDRLRTEAEWDAQIELNRSRA
jgi:bifunctional DNA-binding transcriptional regulator/antitoxin component of YhaV-PrlF toxin-antitoxin module